MNNEERLLGALTRHGGNDVVIPYWDIAILFPSADPHPDSFDYTIIDQETLNSWAKENGFEVSPLPEQAPEYARFSPPIHFKGKHSQA